MRLPGLIDPHVHLREPGAEHKEDFDSGTRAAIAGGFTYVLDMPNNPVPTITLERLADKVARARAKANCDIGFHFGTTGDNLDLFSLAAEQPMVYGLKVYCNHTTGDLLVDDVDTLDAIFRAWESTKPLLVHAEGRELQVCLELAARHDRRLHVCHISRADEVEWVRDAKRMGQRVTAGVCPHHLWLTRSDVTSLHGYAIMKPSLGDDRDQAALWAGLSDRTIDLVESDHAPHTREEKEGPHPAFGVPGLETSVGLVCLGVREGRISKALIEEILYARSAAVFGVPPQQDTWIEFEPDSPYVVSRPFATKCNWSPFEGWELYGEVTRVVLYGRAVLDRKRGA